mmetsp:Transcript_70865/g.179343  ORF Transcript_70865/g.179343 Transcript_70865/m.179343 type:complete len:591 (+) Transcript_70865:226-1998(+)
MGNSASAVEEDVPPTTVWQADDFQLFSWWAPQGSTSPHSSEHSPGCGSPGNDVGGASSSWVPKLGSPANRDSSQQNALAEYLRDILSREDSLRAAFEPVLRATQCPVSGDIDCVAFAAAVARISRCFGAPDGPRAANGLDSPVSRGTADGVLGRAFSPEEALERFRAVLVKLVASLEEQGYPDTEDPGRPLAVQVSRSLAPPASRQEQDWPLPKRRAGAGPWVTWVPSSPRTPLGTWSQEATPPAATLTVAPPLHGEARPPSLPPSPTGSATADHSSAACGVTSPNMRFRPGPTGSNPSQPETGARRTRPPSPHITIAANAGTRATATIGNLATGAADEDEEEDQEEEVREERDLRVKLEGSRGRIAGLRRALAREEALCLWQAAEEDRLQEQLQRRLTEGAQAAAPVPASSIKPCAETAATAADAGQRRAALAEAPATPGNARAPSLPPSLPPAEPAAAATSADCSPKAAPPPIAAATAGTQEMTVSELDKPMSLEDFKRHVGSVRRLKRRVRELEGSLDGYEEQVVALTEELHMRRKLAAATTDVVAELAATAPVATAPPPVMPGPPADVFHELTALSGTGGMPSALQ